MEISKELKRALEEYKSNDTSAFTTIYEESHKYIYVCINNVMYGSDNKDDLIQDIMQDTYIEISRHLDALEDVDRFLSWAGTIATRKCYETIKKTKKYILLNEDETFDDISDDDMIMPEEEKVHTCLVRIPHVMQTIRKYWMQKMHGLKRSLELTLLSME